MNKILKKSLSILIVASSLSSTQLRAEEEMNHQEEGLSYSEDLASTDQQEDGASGEFKNSGAEISGEQLCTMSAEDFQRRALQRDRISIKNPKGMLNTGLCWWHSRFQRNAYYLTHFDSSKPRPTPKSAWKIMDKIMDGKEVVEIPGYSDLDSFIRDHKALFEKRLNQALLTDSLLKAKWVNGLKNTNKPGEMQKEIDKIYASYRSGKVSYIMSQDPGAAAHSFLVVDAQKTQDGYYFELVDSNNPSMRTTYYYKNGSLGGTLGAKGAELRDHTGQSVQRKVFLQEERGFAAYKKGLDKFCKKKTGNVAAFDVKDKQSSEKQKYARR